MSDPGTTAPQPVRKPARFRLSLISIVILALPPALSIAMVIMERGGQRLSAEGIGAALGIWVVGLLLSLLLAFAAYLVSGRSNLLANAVFCVVYLGALGCGNLASWQSQRNTQAQRDIQQQEARILANLRNKHAEVGFVGPDDVHLDSWLASIEKATSQLSGRDRRSQGAATKSMRKLNGAFNVYVAAYHDLMQAGGIELESFKAREDIAQRIELVHTLRRAGDALRDVFEQLPDTYRAHLVEAGSPAAQLDSRVRRYRESLKLETLLPLRDTDRRLCGAMVELLEILQGEWGAWEYDAATEKVLFQNDDAVQRYSAAARRVQELAEDEKRLQGDMLAE